MCFYIFFLSSIDTHIDFTNKRYQHNTKKIPIFYSLWTNFIKILRTFFLLRTTFSLLSNTFRVSKYFAYVSRVFQLFFLLFSSIRSSSNTRCDRNEAKQRLKSMKCFSSSALARCFGSGSVVCWEFNSEKLNIARSSLCKFIAFQWMHFLHDGGDCWYSVFFFFVSSLWSWFDAVASLEIHHWRACAASIGSRHRIDEHMFCVVLVPNKRQGTRVCAEEENVWWDNEKISTFAYVNCDLETRKNFSIIHFYLLNLNRVHKLFESMSMQWK